VPKVYILNRGAHDFSAAEKYGELIYCTDGQLGKYNVSQMVRECEAAMVDSTPADYILLTSLATLCSVACAYFVFKHGRLNLLIYKNDGYVKREVVFDN
jgi:hypothetical protein